MSQSIICYGTIRNIWRFFSHSVSRHKSSIDEKQKEIDELKLSAAKHEKINKDIRMEILSDRINRALQLKEQILPIDLEEEEVELPPLTEKQIKMVEKALRGDPNEVLAQKFSLKITRRDMLTLAGRNNLYNLPFNKFFSIFKTHCLGVVANVTSNCFSKVVLNSLNSTIC